MGGAVRQSLVGVENRQFPTAKTPLLAVQTSGVNRHPTVRLN